VCIRDEKLLISEDYNYTNRPLQYINVQQIVVVAFEFRPIGVARGFMIMSCAARGVKKVGQH